MTPPLLTETRVEDEEQAELIRIDRRFHTCLDREYGRDESRWPTGARYAWLSARNAVHDYYHPKAA